MSSSSHITVSDGSVVELQDEIEPAEIETEPEIETNFESDPDQEDYIEFENQLGLPEYRDQYYGIYASSPPPVDANVNCDKLNNEETKVACKIQVNEDKDKDSSGDTNIVLSLGDKKKTKITVHVEGPKYSNSTIDINVGHFRGSKHRLEIEGDGGTEIHVQIKKSRK